MLMLGDYIHILYTVATVVDHYELNEIHVASEAVYLWLVALYYVENRLNLSIDRTTDRSILFQFSNKQLFFVNCELALSLSLSPSMDMREEHDSECLIMMMN
jgi:hypothetical protein